MAEYITIRSTEYEALQQEVERLKAQLAYSAPPWNGRTILTWWDKNKMRRIILYEYKSGIVVNKGGSYITINQFDSGINRTFSVRADTQYFLYPDSYYNITYTNIRVGHVVTIAYDTSTPKKAYAIILGNFPVAGGEFPTERQVASYQLYWYDTQTGGHLQPEILPYHFPMQPDCDWRNVEWHKSQFREMAYAGIDIALMCWWGFDYNLPYDAWSRDGVQYFSQALTEMKLDGESRPQVGMFFDTTITSGMDLRVGTNQNWFAQNIIEFFTRVPKEHWARVNQRPVVWLFTSDWATGFDQQLFNVVQSKFHETFDEFLYVVRENSWSYERHKDYKGETYVDFQKTIVTDNNYKWGAPRDGYNPHVVGHVGAVGPGYDDRLVRPGGLFIDREEGEFYRRSWEALIADPQREIAVIECFNDIIEGDQVCETVELGRQYLDLTKAYTMQFKQRG